MYPVDKDSDPSNKKGSCITPLQAAQMRGYIVTPTACKYT